jgi:hypothetical protein
MKALTPALGLFFLSMLVSNNSMAQKASLTTNGGLTIGIGAGYAYQKSDLVNSRGFGFDFTIGSPLYHKENAFLGVDWKFRFLAGENKAFDHRINPDNTYSNIRYSFFNYDLELGLTLNRLRERTGIVLTGFAGAGITHGRTFTDLYDAGNNLYDYSSIDPNRDKNLVYNDLVALSDGDFETRLVNKASFLPTAGLFIGYQFSRSLTLGLEFKTNFYLTEENSFVGIDLDNRALSGSGIDRNNYVSLGFRWRLRGGTSRNSAPDNYSTGVTNNYGNNTNTNNRVVQVSTASPSVQITAPSTDPYHTESPFQTIRATIQNVSGPDYISFYQNGFPNNNFTYNANTKSFIAEVRLHDGENRLRIQATNQASTAEDLAIIMLDNPLDAVKSAPMVEFTTPAEDQVTSSSERIDVTATTENIESKEDIQLTLNGSNIPFDYYPVSGSVKTSILLEEGENNMLIKGFNGSGSSQDELTIYFNIPEDRTPPTVRFINPPTPVEVMNNRFPLSAEILNVRGRNDVTLRWNGTSINNFSFDASGRVYVSLILPEGINTMEITARNEAGFASEWTSITYQKPVHIEPVYIEPSYFEPSYFEPVTHEPGTREPVTREPVTREPVTREPVTHERVTPGRVTRDGETHEPVTPDPVIPDPVTPDPVIKNSPPVITIVSPVTNPFRTNEESKELRATVLNVNTKDNITVNINGLNSRNFNFNNSTKVLTSMVSLGDGENSVTIRAQNESGSDTKNQVIIKETASCPLPVISLINPDQGQSSTDQQTLRVKAEIQNIANRNQVSLNVNGEPVSFSFSNHLLNAQVTLTSGTNNLLLNAANECGEDNVSATISYNPPVVEEPCTPPTVSFNLQEADRNDATYELTGSVTGVKTKTGIAITLDGRAYNGFQFAPATGVLGALFNLAPGSHTVVVSVTSECGSDSKSGSVTVEEEEEEACGIRINPGNSAWQFCLVTPSGTFSRENLTNQNFSYSGAASSLYFMPIGGGGKATVSGKPYTVKPGQYYLFTGNLQVNVSTKNPGSMGQWSVCITADRAPVTGNGNNRPKSPCEEQNDDNSKGKGNKQ